MNPEQTTTIRVALLDKEGNHTGVHVPVHVKYTIDVDKNYGADADGNRGVKSIEYNILDVYYDPQEGDRRLLAEELVQVLADAEVLFKPVMEHRARITLC